MRRLQCALGLLGMAFLPPKIHANTLLRSVGQFGQGITFNSFADAISETPLESPSLDIFADWLADQRDPRGPMLHLDRLLAQLPSHDVVLKEMLERERRELLVTWLRSWVPQGHEYLLGKLSPVYSGLSIPTSVRFENGYHLVYLFSLKPGTPELDNIALQNCSYSPAHPIASWAGYRREYDAFTALLAGEAHWEQVEILLTMSRYYPALHYFGSSLNPGDRSAANLGNLLARSARRWLIDDWPLCLHAIALHYFTDFIQKSVLYALHRLATDSTYARRFEAREAQLSLLFESGLERRSAIPDRITFEGAL